MKNLIAKVAMFAILAAPLGLPLITQAAVVPNWNTTGTYVIAFDYLGTSYAHDMVLTQDGLGNLTGQGGSPVGANVYTWNLTLGSVSGDNIDFLANYTATADAVTPQTTMHVIGTVALNGTMSGTWSDNYQGGVRTGTWSTTSGAAVAIVAPSNVTTNIATDLTSTSAKVHGTNGPSVADDTSFWLGTTSAGPFIPLADPTSELPSGWSGVDSQTQLANASFNYAYTGLTPNTAYHFAAWSLVSGIWYPGAVLNFTTASTTSPLMTAINLGTAGNFVILAKSGVSTTGATSVVGNIGVSPAAATTITGFALTLPAGGAFSTSALVTGKIYAPGYADPTPANLTTAVSNMETAYTTANGIAAGVTELGAGNIGGMTLVPGVYKWSTGLTIPTDVTLSGGADDVWVFQVAQNLDIASGKHIILSGDAQAKNVFWVVAGQTTIGTTAVFNGNILDQTAIVLNTGAVLNGRALAQTAVTLDSDTVHTVGTPPSPLLGTLSAEDFGVVNYNTGLGILKGYSAGFGLTDATFAGVSSVVVKLYAGDTLLQTNTAILPKFNADITGVQISSPFDVSGTFDYATDGYWTNVRETQYGQSVPATKVVATVTLANGKAVTAENTNLAGDPTSIYPATIPVVGPPINQNHGGGRSGSHHRNIGGGEVLGESTSIYDSSAGGDLHQRFLALVTQYLNLLRAYHNNH